VLNILLKYCLYALVMVNKDYYKTKYPSVAYTRSSQTVPAVGVMADRTALEIWADGEFEDSGSVEALKFVPSYSYEHFLFTCSYTFAVESIH